MSLNGSGTPRLKVSVQNTEKLSLEQIRAFLEPSEEIEFEAVYRQEIYDWVTQTIGQQEYWRQSDR